jgi:hypothetical protein
MHGWCLGREFFHVNYRLVYYWLDRRYCPLPEPLLFALVSMVERAAEPPSIVIVAQ